MSNPCRSHIPGDVLARVASYRSSAIALFLTCLLMLAPFAARAGNDEGMAKFVPWSGSYWPIREGLLIRGPLQKYDQVTGRRSAAWEMRENPPLPNMPNWFGYCHAWSAAAVMDREPTRLQQATGVGGRPIQLGIADQKGMLTACHTDDVAQHYGIRYRGQPGEDPQDIYPDQLWRVLKLYVKQRGVPLIVDIEGGTQVWNYPVYAYRVSYRPTGQGNTYFAEMSLWMADDAVPPDIVGVRVMKQTYYFTFQLQGGAAVLGSGRWVPPSVNDHPDFAWFPYIVRPENPEVKYELVKKLVRASAADPAGRLPSPPTRPNTDPGTQGTIPLPPNRLPGGADGASLPPNRIPGMPSGAANGTNYPPGFPSAGPAVAAEPSQPYLLSPVELLQLLTNKTSHFTLDVTVDKFDGGQYTPGEPFSVSGTSERAAFLYLLYMGSQGQLTVLFPRLGEPNHIPAQRRFQFPRTGTGSEFRAYNAYGVHRIKAIATSMPLMFSGLAASDDPAAVATSGPRSFRLSPSQRTLFRGMLGRHFKNQRIGSKDLGGPAPRTFLGEFAQDEVAIYVGPPDASEGRPRQ